MSQPDRSIHAGVHQAPVWPSYFCGRESEDHRAHGLALDGRFHRPQLDGRSGKLATMKPEKFNACCCGIFQQTRLAIVRRPLKPESAARKLLVGFVAETLSNETRDHRRRELAPVYHASASATWFRCGPTLHRLEESTCSRSRLRKSNWVQRATDETQPQHEWQHQWRVSSGISRVCSSETRRFHKVNTCGTTYPFSRAGGLDQRCSQRKSFVIRSCFLNTHRIALPVSPSIRIQWRLVK